MTRHGMTRRIPRPCVRNNSSLELELNMTDGTLIDNGADHGSDSMSEVQIELTVLSPGAHAQVIEAVHDLGHDASPDEVEHIMLDAQVADAHITAAEALQHEQSQAAEHGDFATANQLAGDAEYELHAAADHGATVDQPIVEAQHEEMALDNANWHQEIAHDDATSAESYADAGDAHNAESYASEADAHASVAADYGQAGDHDSTYDTTYAAHDSSTDTSHDASATSE